MSISPPASTGTVSKLWLVTRRKLIVAPDQLVPCATTVSEPGLLGRSTVRFTETATTPVEGTWPRPVTRTVVVARGWIQPDLRLSSARTRLTG